MEPLKQRKPLAEDVADRVREEILSGGLEPGERLVEARIAGQLGVSRGPVREALKLLRAEGLVDERPHRGTFVTSLSVRDVRDIYDLRAAIESAAARLVAVRGTDADLRSMRRHFDQLVSAAASGDLASISAADLAFHDTLCSVSGNRRMHRVFDRNVPLLRSLIRLDGVIYAARADIASEHEPLVLALEARDPKLAAELFCLHIERARDLVVDYIEHHPDEQ
jgi:GntR family transcriptional regulator, gluconate operon transcriptional repressor